MTLTAPLHEIRRSRITLLVLAFAFTEGAVLLGALTLMPPAIEHTGATSTLAGGVTAIYGMSVFLSSRLVSRLSAHWHPSRLIGIGGAAAVAGCTLFSISQTPAMAVVVATLIGLAWVAMHSSLQTWATEVLPSARAVVVSLFAGSLFVGSALAALAVAGLAEAGEYTVIYATYACVAVPLTLVASWARSRWQRPSDVVARP